MNAVIAQHPWASVVCAMLAGMMVKWLLDLFFLRSELFGLRRRLSDRERDLTDLRHEHGRSLQELRNRLTELDATAKSKVAALAALAERDAELAAARQSGQLLRAESETAVGRASVLTTEVDRLQRALSESESRVTDREGALGRLTGLEQELRRELAVIRSVRGTLETAVLSRDARLAELTEERDGLRGSLETVAARVVELSESSGGSQKQLASISARLAGESAARVQAENEVGKLRGQVETAERARVSSDSLLKRREMELGEVEQRAGEMQRALDEASRESARVAAENNRLAGDLARVEARLSSRKVDESSARESGVLLKASEAAAAELRLQLAAAVAQRKAVEAELEAVSASHAELEARLGAEPTTSSAPTTDAAGLLVELEEVCRERNALAAELAGLRGVHPADRKEAS